MDGTEKRKMERFDLEIPIYLSVVDMSDKHESFKYTTTNICSEGAFLKTKKPLSEGTDVKLDMVLHLNKLNNFRDKISRIKVSGTVTRTDQQGMAIAFDKNYRISSY